MVFPGNTHNTGQAVWPDAIPSELQIYGSVTTVAEVCHTLAIDGAQRESSEQACHRKERGGLICLGRRGRGFFWAKQIRVHLSTIHQKFSQILGSAL